MTPLQRSINKTMVALWHHFLIGHPSSVSCWFFLPTDNVNIVSMTKCLYVVYYQADFLKNLPGREGKFWFREVNIVTCPLWTPP